MTLGKRIGKVFGALAYLLCVFLLYRMGEDGFKLVCMLMSLSLILFGVRNLLFYFTMARHMVNGKAILYVGVIGLDFGIFSEWAVVYDQFLTISESIKKGGTLRRETDGELVPSPLLSKLHSTITLLRGLQSDLGFTPSSRSRVVSFGKESEKTGNKFADL